MFGNFATGKSMFVMCVCSWLAVFVFAREAPAKQVQVDVSLGTPVMEAGKKQTAYLKVGLTGFDLPSEGKRAPVNVVLVLDRSGSMQGDKIEKAKEAALLAVERLNSNDILSVVSYESTVHVLLPATKVSDKETIRKAIRRIAAGGQTALFAGVSKGAFEIRKFLDDNRVNRIVLLSDGLANVGPKSPNELGALGGSLRKEGISVSTVGLGLGFNEDLMTQLALESDGNHAFAENSEDLVGIFDKEFGDILSVVAQEIVVKIHCDRDIRPVRLLGREGEIDGRVVTVSLNQIYSNQEKYVLLEVEVPASNSGEERPVANVEVTYANMETKTDDRLSHKVSVAFTESREDVEKNVNKEVMISCVRQIGNDTNRAAVALRDQGRKEEARDLLLSNSIFLRSNARDYDSPVLVDDALDNDGDGLSLESEEWSVRRKLIRSRDHRIQTQQGYRK